MIPNTQETQGEYLSSSNSQSNFGMAVSPEAFKIMSSQIYQYKSAAVVREYLCNASDSHAEAGKVNVPFDVYLPNDLSPFFRVRDYGIGLDAHGVEKVFATYFGSTKKHTNEAVGFLGLGSKSGYSYADTFTIIAIKDGVERVYVAYFDENKIPALSKMSERKTDDINGVEIKVPVKTHDYSRFAADVGFIASFLRVKPNIHGGDAWNENVREDIIAKGWATTSTGINSHVSSLYNIGYDSVGIVMGGVVYPLSNYAVRDILSSQEGTEPYTSFIYQLRSKMFVEVPMGSVEFAASRETLSLTEHTKDVVAYNIIKAIEAILADVDEFVRTADHPVTAYREVNKTIGFVPSTIAWNENTLKKSAFRPMRNFLGRMGISVVKSNGMGFTTRSSSDLIDLYEKCVITIRDTKRPGAIKWSKEWAKSNNVSKTVLICSKPISDRKLSRLVTLLGLSGNDVISQNDIIPKASAIKKQKADEKQVRAVWKDITKGDWNPSSLVDVTEGTYYVDTHSVNDGMNGSIRFGVLGHQRGIILTGLVYLDVLRECGVKRIIRMNSQNKAKLLRLGVPELGETLAKRIESVSGNVLKEMRRDMILSKMPLDSYTAFNEAGSRWLDTVDIPDEVKEVVEYGTNQTSSDNYRMFARFIDLSYDEIQEINNMVEPVATAILRIREKHYPFISTHNTQNKDEVVDYIKAMDLYYECKLMEQL